MHLSDGILPASILAGGAAVAAVGAAVGLAKLDDNRVPQVGVMTSAFFVASFIHVPLGVTSVHLLLIGLTGLVLGWAIFPAVLVALALQAMLGHGGWTTIGVNAAMMATPGLAAYLLFGWVVRRPRTPLWAVGLAGAAAGALGILGAAAIMAGTLTLAGEDFHAVAAAALIAHLPIALVEAAVTAFVILGLRRLKPDVLHVPIQTAPLN